jgi:hypothetical protein
MDRSPYTPGAGHKPPVLAGRADLLQLWRTALNDVPAMGRVRARDVILTGPRGVGKTATVTTFAELSRPQGYEVVNLQAAAGNAGLIDSLFAHARARIEAGSGPWQRAKRVFERIGAFNVTIAGTGAGVTVRDATGPPRATSPEDLALALATLAAEVQREAANGGLLVTLDEVQVAAHADLALLAAALQRLNVDHPTASVMFAGTGLPHTPDVLREAGVTHPDRLFDVHAVPLRLDHDDARFAIVEPARLRDVTWEPEAADLIVEACNGYPAHLQVFAHHAWTAAAGPHHITLAEAQAALGSAAAEIDRRTFGPRLERLTGRQLEFLAALALHGGRAPTKTIAATLGKTQKALSVARDALITEGDVYAPRWGELALTVPLFGPYLLAHYDQARARSTSKLMPLDEMRASAGNAAIIDSAAESSPRRTPALSPGDALTQPQPHRGRRPGGPERGPSQ